MSETLDVFHGTTRSAADAIVRNGFRALDAWALCCEVAAQHGLEVGELWNSPRSRYLRTSRADDGQVWFTRDRIRAISWAHQRGEARFGLLQAVWQLLHPDRADDGASSEWALTQLGDEVPTLVTLRVPYERIAESFRPRMSPRRALPSVRNIMDREREGFFKIQIPITPPIPREWIVEFRPAERLLDLCELADILGKRPGVVLEAVRQGQIPKPSNGDVARPRWPISELHGWLKSQGISI